MENLFGRRKIYTVASEITEANVVDEVNKALSAHFKNVEEETYLYWYRRGKQPILDRVKEIRPEITSKIVQNIANEIVAFKNGYFLTKPTFYVTRRDGLTEKVNELNDYLYTSGKADADNALVDWMHTVGLGVLYVCSDNDEDAPVKAYSVDPRQAFVVYSSQPGNKPMMGINVVATGEKDGNIIYDIDVFTNDKIFRMSGGAGYGNYVNQLSANASVINAIEANMQGDIPIVEYSYDRNRMGAFEAVLPLLDALNDVQSNREDGVAQFVQSLMVFYNCQLGEDDKGNAITPAYIRESGAIFLKSVGQDKADLKILNEQLDQNQTQTLVNDLTKQIFDIAGVPLTDSGSAGTSDNVGAVYLRNGFASADTMARNAEDLYKESDRRFTKIFLNILSHKSENFNDVKVSDLDVQFTRNELENLLVRTQGALNLKMLGLSPELVLAKSGVSNDPTGDIIRSKGYIETVFKTKEDIEAEQERFANDNDKTDEGTNFGDREDIE